MWMKQVRKMPLMFCGFQNSIKSITKPLNTNYTMTSITERLDKPKNQYAQAVLLLMEYGNTGVTMVDAMKDFFHKFQSRLGEVEKLHPKIQVRRLRMNTKNRFGHPCSYINYKSVAPKPYLIHLFQLLNREGLK